MAIYQACQFLTTNTYRLAIERLPFKLHFQSSFRPARDATAMLPQIMTYANGFRKAVMRSEIGKETPLNHIDKHTRMLMAIGMKSQWETRTSRTAGPLRVHLYPSGLSLMRNQGFERGKPNE